MTDTTDMPTWLRDKQEREAKAAEEALAAEALAGRSGCMRIGYTNKDGGYVMLQGFPFDPTYTLTFTADEAYRIGKGLVAASKKARRKDS